MSLDARPRSRFGLVLFLDYLSVRKSMSVLADTKDWCPRVPCGGISALAGFLQ